MKETFASTCRRVARLLFWITLALEAACSHRTDLSVLTSLSSGPKIGGGPQVNGEPIGGGGELEQVRDRIVAALTRYLSGLPGSFAYASAQCRQLFSPNQCSILAKINQSPALTAFVRSWMSANGLSLLQIAKTVVFHRVSQPLAIVGPNGEQVAVEAIARPDGIYVNQSYVAAANSDDLTALVTHELNHLLSGNPRDFVSLAVNSALSVQTQDLFDELGASLATDELSLSRAARDTVLSDKPLALLSFEDPAGSLLAVDVSPNANNGTYDNPGGSRIQLGQPSAYEGGDSSLTFGNFPQPANGQPVNPGGGLTLSLPGLSKSSLATVAFWIKADAGDVDPQATTVLLHFGNYSLSFQYGAFGFSTGCQDLLGVDAYSFVGHWVHVVAKFSNGNLDRNALYIDGVPMVMTQRGSNSCPQNAVLADAAGFGDWSGASSVSAFYGSVDDLAVFASDLSEPRIQVQYQAARSETQSTGQAMVLMTSGTLQSAGATISLPANCPRTEILVFSRTPQLFCGTASGIVACPSGPSPTYTFPSALVSAQDASTFTTAIFTKNAVYVGASPSSLGVDYIVRCVPPPGKTAQSAPVINPIPNLTLPAGGQSSLRILASDPTGDPLTYTATVQPLGTLLRARYGLYFSTSQYDSATIHWINGRVLGANRGWYKIVAGQILSWSGSANGTDTLLAAFDPSIIDYFAHPEYLYAAPTLEQMTAAAQLAQQYGFYGAPLVEYGVIWWHGNVLNDAQKGWYYISQTDYRVYAWSGDNVNVVSGTAVSAGPLGAEFYAAPGMLINPLAPPNLAATDLTLSLNGNLLSLSLSGSYAYPIAVRVGVSNGTQLSSSYFGVNLP